MSLFRVPRGVAKVKERAVRDFLWDGANGDLHCHLVAWKHICKPKVRGSLSIGNICLRNKAISGKW